VTRQVATCRAEANSKRLRPLALLEPIEEPRRISAEPLLGLAAHETLLAAFGACNLSNVNKKAAALGAQIDDARIEFTGMRCPKPLGIEALGYQLILTSAEPADILEQVYEHATSIGSATNAILNGLNPHGELRIEMPL